MSFAASRSMKLTTSKTGSLAAPMGLRPRLRTARLTPVCAQQQQVPLLAPTVAATVAASLASPEFANATTLTPTVSALLNSVVAGGIVAGLILGAVTLVAGFDPIARK